jgi:hypothetical protein
MLDEWVRDFIQLKRNDVDICPRIKSALVFVVTGLIWLRSLLLAQHVNYFSVTGFEGLTAVVMKVAIIWYIAPCIPYLNRRFGETFHLHLQGRKAADQETSRSLATC